MTVVDALRKAFKQSIAENPIQVTVQRTKKVDMGGYFDEVTSQHGPFTVRVFQQGSRIPQEISTLAGTRQVDKSWGLLADYQADLQAGPNVKDEFDVPGLGHFMIVAVYPQMIGEEIISYKADLEKVD